MCLLSLRIANEKYLQDINKDEAINVQNKTDYTTLVIYFWDLL